MAETGTGRVVLAGAPLGNVGDASTRLREVLASADIVAAEDTRRLLRLARDLDVTVGGRIVSYFEGNEERRTPDLVEALSSPSSPTAACRASRIPDIGWSGRPWTPVFRSPRRPAPAR